MSETIANTQAEIASKETAAGNEQLELLQLLSKPETQESLTTLIEQLPKIVEMVNFMSESYDFIKAVSTDETFKNDAINGFNEVAGPVINLAKNAAATAIEAKDLADESTETVGLFGLLKLLKDPQVQKTLRFANAFLALSADKQK